MTHLLCIFVTLIIGIVIVALLYWVFNMALGLLDPVPAKAALAVKVLIALILVIMIIYWLLNGMPCLFRI